jgi:hypothetical protein
MLQEVAARVSTAAVTYSFEIDGGKYGRKSIEVINISPAVTAEPSSLSSPPASQRLHLGLVEAASSSAAALSSLICHLFQEHGIDLVRC